MRQDTAKGRQSSRVSYETLEGFVREKAQGFYPGHLGGRSKCIFRKREIGTLFKQRVRVKRLSEWAWQSPQSILNEWYHNIAKASSTRHG